MKVYTKMYFVHGPFDITVGCLHTLEVENDNITSRSGSLACLRAASLPLVWSPHRPCQTLFRPPLISLLVTPHSGQHLAVLTQSPDRAQCDPEIFPIDPGDATQVTVWQLTRSIPKHRILLVTLGLGLSIKPETLLRLCIDTERCRVYSKRFLL